jgi:predicted MPP superfamily phosphohydrolase
VKIQHIGFVFVVSLLFLPFIALFVPNVKADPPENLVTNPSFEDGSGAEAYNWTYLVTQNKTVTRTTNQKVTGSYSYQLWSNTSSFTTGYSNYGTVTEGYSYNITYNYKTQIPNTETYGFYAVIRLKNSTHEITYFALHYVTITTDWTKYTTTFTIPTGYNYTQTRVQFTLAPLVANDEIYAWVDDVSFTVVVDSWISSQGFVIPYADLPTTIRFQAKFLNGTYLTSVTSSDFKVYLGTTELTVNSVTYNSSTQLHDVVATVPILATGKYLLKLRFYDKNSLNCKGVNIYSNSASFSFVHMTDAHMGLGFINQLETTMQIIYNINPDFILFTGDMQASETWIQSFFNILYDLNFGIPIFFVKGNHESDSFAILERHLLYLGSNTTMFEGYQYPTTFNYGEWQFIGLDTAIYPYTDGGNISDSQYSWLEQQTSSQPTVVFMHHPLYFDGVHPYPGVATWIDESVAEKVINLLEASNVKVVLSGHMHRESISVINDITYLATVSLCNSTCWVGDEPYPPGGFRKIQIENNQLSFTTLYSTFSYYTGEFVGGTEIYSFVPSLPTAPPDQDLVIDFYGSGDISLLSTYLIAGDLLGFITACYTTRIGQVFYAILALIVTIPLAIRTQSITFVALIWLLLGGLFMWAVPTIFGVGTLFIILAIASLLYKLFAGKNE